MAFPNQGQMPAASGVAMPGLRGPRMPMKKPVAKKPALNPLAARQALVNGMKGC